MATTTAFQTSSFTPVTTFLSATSQSSNSTPPSDNAPSLAKRKEHQRAYQACQNCRNSKTRCQRGDVDNPTGGPCARCRREGKQCQKAPHRSKKSRVEAPEHSDGEELGTRGQRKRARTDSIYSAYPNIPSATGYGNIQPPSFELRTHQIKKDEEEVGKAMKILENQEFKTQNDTLGGLAQLNNTLNGSPPSQRKMSQLSPSAVSDHFSLDEAVAGTRTRYGKVASLDQVQEACAEWSRFLFVRERLFTAQEAINYVSSFYFHMTPLTPITIPNFEEVTTHRRLLNDEPVLALTIITIASRYFLPAVTGCKPGPGATSRAVEIHNRCWTRLEFLIGRTLWGQDRIDLTHPSRALRSPGMIESLLLLTEWHARALHFPLSDGLESLMARGDAFDPYASASSGHNMTDRDSQGNLINSWLGPCVRSGHMSWSLLNNAMAIAVELGIFDPNTFSDPHAILTADQLRAQRLGRLIYIYMESTCLRLGLVTNLPTKPPHVSSFINKSHDDHTNSPRLEHILFHWERIGQIIAECDKDTSKDRAQTKKLIETRGYEEHVKRHDAELFGHSRKLGKCKIVPKDQRRILNFEIQYARVRLASIALQAIIARILAVSRSPRHDDFSPDTLSNIIEPDRKIIDHMVEASLSFLGTVETFIEDKGLMFIPVRSFFRITSVSLILIKCFSIGLNPARAAHSLRLLQKTANALREIVCDDVHVSLRIGQLLADILDRLRGSMRFHRLGPSSGGDDTGTFQAPPPPEPPARIENIPPPPPLDDPSSYAVEWDYPEPSLSSLQGITIYDFNSERQAQAHVPPPSGPYQQGLEGWFTAPWDGMVAEQTESVEPLLGAGEEWMRGGYWGAFEDGQ